MKMHRKLDKLQYGLIEPQRFLVEESLRKCQNLNLSTFVEIESVHTGGINTIDADNINGHFLLSGCGDGSIYIHDLRNFGKSPHYNCKAVHKIDKEHAYVHTYSVETVQWFPFDNGVFLTSGMDKTLKIWDTERMEPAETRHFGGRIFQHNMRQVPSGTSLVAVGTTINQALVVDMRTGSTTHELRGHSSSILTCKWSPNDENLLATGSADNKIMLWDIRTTRNCLRTLDQHNGNGRSSKEKSVMSHSGMVNGLRFTRSGLHLLSIGTDSCLRLWDVASGKNLLVNFGCIPNDTRRSVQLDVSVSSRDECVFVPSEGYIMVHSLSNGMRIKKLTGHFNSVNCCYFHPSKVHLYSGSNDRIILCWASEIVEEDCEENDKNDFIVDDWSTDGE